jgi:hypothetical protein
MRTRGVDGGDLNLAVRFFEDGLYIARRAG